MKNEKLKQVLATPHWIDGTKTMAPAGLVSFFFQDWQMLNELSSKDISTIEKMSEEFGEAATLVFLIWNYMAEVNNGGHALWYENGYASSKEWMLNKLESVDLKDYPNLQNGLKICDESKENSDIKTFRSLDEKFYELNDAFMEELDQWTIQQLDLKFELITNPDERFKKAQYFMNKIFSSNQPAQRQSKEANTALKKAMREDAKKN